MLVLFFRVIILYFLTLFFLRLMGKREIGQLQPFDLIVSMMIAELACQPLEDVNVPLMSGILPVLVLLFLQIFVSYLSLKSRKLRRLICGESVLLIENGKINQKYMKSMLINHDDLLSMLREAGIFDITKADFLSVETNGKTAVTQKKDKSLAVSIIENGKIIKNHLIGLGISEGVLYEELEKSKVGNIENVFWGLYYDNKFYFIEKEKQ